MISSLSLTTTKLTMKAQGHAISTGTAFFYSHGERVYLITNRHNLTGLNNFTNEKLDKKNGAIPNGLSFETVVFKENSDGTLNLDPTKTNIFSMKWAYPQRPWFEHPSLGAVIDIVAIDVKEEFTEAKDFSFACVNSQNDSKPILLSPALPISVIGYPVGKTVAGTYPVWVNGTIASEPLFDVDEIPAMYIDCRTNAGSSGSPVFAYSAQGAVQLEYEAQDSGAMMTFSTGEGHQYATFGKPVHKFIGIYSGRINSSSDIGYVWKPHLIAEICAARSKAIEAGV